MQPVLSNRAPVAVLFDRDGTLVVDVPYNGDPARVRPVPGAVEAVARLREGGLRLGIVTNQAGIGRGLISREQVEAVNQRVGEIFGGFDVVAVCPHAPEAHCDCRKPQPGLVLAACHTLAIEPPCALVIGDIGTDVRAARAAGAQAVLVPTSITDPADYALADLVLPDLEAAADLVLERSESASTPSWTR